ncbi:hypothetical protein HOY80DRAFT_1101700 [Tuber brumale]|nr:hypothetical protein HOY80DRAFT_1101700 [Tuber brumale]
MITTLTRNACSTPISPNGTRVIRHVCANYDLCTNCHALARFSDSHEVQHETLVLYPPTSISRDHRTSPHPRPAPLEARIPTTASNLLSSNNTPTRRLKDLSDAVFAYVSRAYPSANQHLLNPGRVLNFYELGEKPLKENSVGGWVSAADTETAYLYDRLGIEYSLITRVTRGVSQVVTNGMPVLGPRGFRQLLVSEILEDRERAHSFSKQLVRLVTVDDGGRAFEEVPRGMFPAEPDPAYAAKVAAVIGEFPARAETLPARVKRESEEKDRRKLALAQEANLAAIRATQESLATMRYWN